MFYTIGFTSALSILLPISIFILNYKNKSTDILPIAIYLIIGFGFEVLNMLLIFSKKNTIVTENLFNLFETIILGIIVTLWVKEKKLKQFQILCLIIFGIVATGYQIYFGLNQMHAELKIGYTLLLISFYFIYILKTENLFDNLNSAKTIFGIAVLFYFLMNSIIFSFRGFLLSDLNKKFWVYYLVIHSIINILYNAAITISLIKWTRK